MDHRSVVNLNVYSNLKEETELRIPEWEIGNNANYKTSDFFDVLNALCSVRYKKQWL